MYTCIIWYQSSLSSQFKKLDMPEHNKSALEAWGLLVYVGEKKRGVGADIWIYCHTSVQTLLSHQ